MREAMYAALSPVRSRQQMMFALRATVAGVAVGGGLALALGAVRLMFALEISWVVPALLLAAGPVIGFLVGLGLWRGWHGAAEAVDAHYGLKDRAVSALAFSDLVQPTELQTVAVNDALSHLNTVESKAVVPLTAPRVWPAALAALVAGVAVFLIPLRQREAEAGPAPPPDYVLAVAADQKAKLPAINRDLSETIQDIDDEKGEEDRKAANRLKDELEKKTQELTEDGTDQNEALAKLSEMMAAWQSFADQLNVAALDGQMSQLGTALAASQAFEGAGKALMEGKLEKAVKELEKLDQVKLTPKEEKALQEKLEQLKKQMGDAGQGSLGEAVGELADAIKSGNGKVGQAAKTLGKKINNAVKRKKANDLALAQLAELQEAKSQCNCNGGARLRQPQKSDSPSSNWGRGISGNTDGEKTKLPGKRTEQQVTGTPGSEGETDVETSATPEAREQARRAYAEKFQKFSKESETVIDGEPIPLGHRQMVKKYFELIRPSNSDGAEKKATEPEKK